VTKLLPEACQRLYVKTFLCFPCDILERSHEEEKEICLMGNRLTRAAGHLPMEAVQERIRRENRSWLRQRWEIIFQALVALVTPRILPRPWVSRSRRSTG
jgi:hypothetical protein